MESVVILQFLLSTLLTFSLSELWGMMNGLAMIVYLPMFNMIFPANFTMLNDFLITVATYDMVPKIDDINAYFFTTHYSEGIIT